MWLDLKNDQFYYTNQISYKILRVSLLFITYYLFAEDYKSISQTFVLKEQFRQFASIKLMNLLAYGRLLVVIWNELIVLWVIWTTDIVTNGPLDLIVNFSGAMFVCELDNLVM